MPSMYFVHTVRDPATELLMLHLRSWWIGLAPLPMTGACAAKQCHQEAHESHSLGLSFRDRLSHVHGRVPCWAAGQQRPHGLGHWQQGTKQRSRCAPRACCPERLHVHVACAAERNNHAVYCSSWSHDQWKEVLLVLLPCSPARTGADRMCLVLLHAANMTENVYSPHAVSLLTF